MHEEVEEEIGKGKEELKRVDHLIYVSLKYTRTGDVLKNVIERLMNSFDCMVRALVVQAKEEKKIDSVPTAPIEMAEKAKELYSDDEKLVEMVDFYILLRRISKAEFESDNEYRRYVKIMMDIDKKKIVVDIDSVTEYYAKAKEYFEYLEEILK